MIDVEPLITSELDRMLPLPDGRRADWDAVLRKAGMQGAGRGRITFPVGPRGWRPVLVVGAIVVALVLAAVAIADVLGAFNGISAARHPQTRADNLDPNDLPRDCGSGSPIAAASPFCHLVLDSSRLLRTLPDGGRLWAVTDTEGDLCVILQDGDSTASCGSALTPKQPTTVTSGQANDNLPTVAWGITLDRVTAVSLQAGGKEVTVPVKDNVWFYEGASPSLTSLTVHFADGSTERPLSDEPNGDH